MLCWCQRALAKINLVRRDLLDHYLLLLLKAVCLHCLLLVPIETLRSCTPCLQRLAKCDASARLDCWLCCLLAC